MVYSKRMQKEPTLKDIQNSIVDLKTTLVGRIDSLEERMDDLHEAMDVHSTEMDRQFREARNNAATKSYVDDRIGQLRGEFVSMIKRSGHRTSAA